MVWGFWNVKFGLLLKLDYFEIGYVFFLIFGLGIFVYNYLIVFGLLNVVGSIMLLNIIIFGKIFYFFNLWNDYFVIFKYFF